MQVYGMTDIGRVRAENQDMFACDRLSDTAVYAVVCDGMGGVGGGKIASNMTVDTISGRIASQYRENMPQASILNLLESAVDAANVVVLDKALEDVELAGMGTTLVAAVVDGNYALAVHVGDSRLYMLHDGILRQVTVDHSVVQEMVEKGQITIEEARCHPRKHFITRAIGVEGNVRPDFETFELEDGDMLLLCTDGLTNMLTDGEIEAIMQTNAAETLPKILVETANEKGGEDNITVVVIA